MLKKNYIYKIKDLPESLRQFAGLIIITIIVIISFSILNGIFGQGDELVKKMKLEEERIAEEKQYMSETDEEDYNTDDLCDSESDDSVTEIDDDFE